MQVNGRRFVSLIDVVGILGGDPHAADIQSGFFALPEEHRSIEDLVNEDLTAEPMPVVSTHGLAMFLAASPQVVLRTFALSLMSSELERLWAVSPVVSTGSGGTRWGEQPFRNLIRGTGLSMAEVVKTLNMHLVGDEKPVTQASLTAIAMGRQLPTPQVMRCLAVALVAVPSKLFAPDALAAYERKYGPTPQSRPSSRPSSPPAARLAAAVSEPAPALADDDEEDMTSDAYWEKQERLANAAFEEVVNAAPAPSSGLSSGPAPASSFYESLVARSQQEAADSQFDPED